MIVIKRIERFHVIVEVDGVERAYNRGYLEGKLGE
jgi:hypothetical protein